MKQALKIEFFNKNGELVPELSPCPADVHQLQALVYFLGDSNSFKVSVVDLEAESVKLSE